MNYLGNVHGTLAALRHLRPQDRGVDYSSVLESDLPIVVQHTRLDSRQAEEALLTTIAYSQ